MNIFTCPECSHKELADTEEAYHNCGNSSSYKMRKKSVEKKAESRITREIRSGLIKNNLINDEVKSFGYRSYNIVRIPIDIRKIGFLSIKSWSISEDEVKKFLKDRFNAGNIVFNTQSLINSREIKEVEFCLDLGRVSEEVNQIKKRIEEEVEEAE